MYTLLLVAMAVWGINLSAVKTLTATLDVLTVAAVRMVVAAVALTVLLMLRRERFPSIGGRQGIALALCALVMVYGNQILFAGGLAKTTATNAALILSLSPLMSSIFAAVVFRERLTGRRAAGVALGFAGVALVILNRPHASLGAGTGGDALILASVACFASGGIAVQRLSMSLTPLQIGWSVHVFGAAFLVLQASWAPDARFASLAAAPATTWGLILYSGVFATAIAALVWNLAIARLGASRTALAIYWVPIFGVAFAAAFLGEPLTLWHLAGLAAVILGARLGSGARR
jgi:drug/metabolite transporter (DMT)-like permease